MLDLETFTFRLRKRFIIRNLAHISRNDRTEPPGYVFRSYVAVFDSVVQQARDDDIHIFDLAYRRKQVRNFQWMVYVRLTVAAFSFLTSVLFRRKARGGEDLLKTVHNFSLSQQKKKGQRNSALTQGEEVNLIYRMTSIVSVC